MIKTFETSKGKFEITDNYNPDEVVTISNPFIYSVKETVKLIAKVSDITEEQAKEVVEDFLNYEPWTISGGDIAYKNYISDVFVWDVKDSFSSLLESLSITDTTNLYLFKILE